MKILNLLIIFLLANFAGAQTVQIIGEHAYLLTTNQAGAVLFSRGSRIVDAVQNYPELSNSIVQAVTDADAKAMTQALANWQASSNSIMATNALMIVKEVSDWQAASNAVTQDNVLRMAGTPAKPVPPLAIVTNALPAFVAPAPTKKLPSDFPDFYPAPLDAQIK